jgi:hypothetical protein
MYPSTPANCITESPPNGEPPSVGSSPDQPALKVGGRKCNSVGDPADLRQEKRDRDNEMIQVKVRRKTWKTLKVVSAWKEVDIADYVEELVSREGLHDVNKFLDEFERRQKGQ